MSRSVDSPTSHSANPPTILHGAVQVECSKWSNAIRPPLYTTHLKFSLLKVLRKAAYDVAFMMLIRAHY